MTRVPHRAGLRELPGRRPSTAARPRSRRRSSAGAWASDGAHPRLADVSPRRTRAATPAPDPVPRPGGRPRRDPAADRPPRVPVGLLAGHRHRLHARLRRPLDRRRSSTARGEFEHHGIKRYDDTILIGDEATLDGIDSPRSHAALRRLNRIHGHYDIPDHEFAYVLATTIVGPVALDRGLRLAPSRRPRARRDHPGDHPLRRADGDQGPAHDVRRLPGAARRLRAARTSPTTPANRGVAEASIRIAAATIARPRCDRSAPGHHRADGRAAAVGPRPAPPAGLVGARRTPGPAAAGGRAAVRPPRTEPKAYAATTYPHGYRLADLGPRTMLDALNAHPAPPPPPL